MVLRDSTDLGARVGLAVALREAGRADEARTVLEDVVADRPADPGPVLLLGLTYEETGDWGRARETYGRYLEIARSASLKASVERRLPYVHRRQLEAEVENSIRHEAEFGDAPDAAAVAVFPFLFLASDSGLRPLSRALAELLVTDLGTTQRLRILERSRVQLLLDELEMGGTALVDPTTAGRSGRLLRAGRVVQGTIEGDAERLRLGAVLVSVGRDSLAPLKPVSEEDALAQLFDMEKQLALGLYSSLGVQLTAAERERVLQRPTQNLEALLAFGLGLEAEDRGDYAEAARQYERARALDPGFEMAGERAGEVIAISETERTTVEVLVQAGVDDEGIAVPPGQPARNAGPASPPPSMGTGPGLPGSPILSPDPIGGFLPDPFRRDPGAEVLGMDGIGTRTLLRIIFRRPTG